LRIKCQSQPDCYKSSRGILGLKYFRDNKLSLLITFGL
jgi:hypothetical protein